MSQSGDMGIIDDRIPRTALEKMLDISDSIAYVVDTESYELLYCNRAGLKYGGLDSFSGMRCHEAFQHLDKPCPWCTIPRIEDDSPHHREVEVPELNGHFNVSCQRLPWNERDAFCFMVTDITEAHRATEELEKSYERTLRQFLEANPQTLCLFRLNLTANTFDTVEGTDHFVRDVLVAATVDKFFQNIISVITNPRDREAARDVFDRKKLISRFGGGQTQLSLSYRRRTADGESRWVTAYIGMARNPETGDVIGVISSIDSNDEIIDEEIQRFLTEKDYELVSVIDVIKRTIEIRFAGQQFASVDISRTNRYITDYDEQCREVADRWVGTEAEAGVYRERTALDHVIRQLAKEDRYSFEVTARDPGGVMSCKQLRYAYLDDSKKLILLMQEDVTPIYLAEQARQRELAEKLEIEKKLKAEAQQANRAKTDFLSRMSHDIRTPMNGIIGMTRIAQEYENPPETVDCLIKIDTASRFLLGIVNDILDLSKVESGRRELDCEPYPASDLLAYIEAFIRPLSEDNGIDLTVDAESVKGVVPLIDRLGMNQIVFNLLSNAIKFTPEGGHVSFHATMRRIDDDHVTLIAVISDDGVGMSPEFLDHLFEPFSQEHQAYSPKVQGTGLGLAIVRNLVDLMGGTIDVSSAEGAGTTFTMTSIFECVSEETAARSGDTIENFTGSLEGRHLLICEDNSLNIEITQHMVEKVGAQVQVTQDGQQGVDAFLRSPIGYFDAVLMDIRMPMMDGITATQTIRRAGRNDATHIPIIAMTANAYDEDVQRCLAAGMNAHISKPVDPATLYRTLRRLIAG